MYNFSKKRILKINNIKHHPPLLNFEILNNEECNIVEKIISGYSYQDIADELNISKSTVCRRYNAILEKLRKNESTT